MEVVLAKPLIVTTDDSILSQNDPTKDFRLFNYKEHFRHSLLLGISATLKNNYKIIRLEMLLWLT